MLSLPFMLSLLNFFITPFFILLAKGVINNEDIPPILNDIIQAVSKDVSSKPKPLAPLYIIKKELSVAVKPISIGNKYIVLLKLFLLLRIEYLVIPKNTLEIIAENKGDIIHDNIIPETPPTYGNNSFSSYQVTH